MAASHAVNEQINLSLFTIFARARGLIKEAESIPYHTIVTGSAHLLGKERDFSAVKPEKWTTVWHFMQPTPVGTSGETRGCKVMSAQELQNCPRRPATAWASVETRFRAIMYLFRQPDNVPSQIELERWLESSLVLCMDLVIIDFKIRKAWAKWFDPSRLQLPDVDDFFDLFDQGPYPVLPADVFVINKTKAHSILTKFARDLGTWEHAEDFPFFSLVRGSSQPIGNELDFVEPEKLNTACEPKKQTPACLDKPRSFQLLSEDDPVELFFPDFDLSFF